MEWQPIETAPKDETNVLCFDNGGVFVASFALCKDDWGKSHCWVSGSESCNGVWGWCVIKPTHWMPLPPPPSEK